MFLFWLWLSASFGFVLGVTIAGLAAARRFGDHDDMQ